MRVDEGAVGGEVADGAHSGSLVDSFTPGIDVHDVSTYLFAADKAAPRRKRASDVVQFLFTALIFGLMSWMAANEPPVDERILEFTRELPGWLTSIGWIGYTGALLVMVGLLIVMLARGGIGRGVLRDVIVAFVLVLGLTILMSRLITSAWPTLFPEFQDDRVTYPTLRTAMVLAGAWILSPYVTAPVQRVLRWTVGAALISPFILSLTTLTHLGGAIALAAAAVAAVRLLFGSPEGLPPIDRLADTLRRAGVATDNLAYLSDQPGTVGLATATVPGSDLRYTIKVYGEDVANRQRTERVWRAMWYRTEGAHPRAGRIEQAQNEALALLTCRLAGIDCPELVTSGQDIGGDVVVVTIDPGGSAVGDLDAGQVDDDLLISLWAAVGRLHREARITHNLVSPHTMWVDGDGAVSFVDLLHASTMPTEQQKGADLAALFTTTGILAGPDAAVDVAAAHVERDTLEMLLPYLQDAAIAPELRKEAKRAGFKIDDLRSDLSTRLEVEEPELAPIQRVTWSKIVMLVFALLAANALISQIADVGFDTIVEELQNASAGWLVAAFIVKLLSYSTAYFGLRAVVPKPIPFAPTTLLQSAKSYVGLVVPSMVGRVGLDIRFLQKQGVSTTVAATQGPVISLVGFSAEVILLLLCAWALGQTVETDSLLDINVSGILTLVIIIVVIGVVVALGVPKLRAKVLPVVKDAIAAARTIVASPRTLLSVFGSETADRLLGAVALGCTCAAFGVDLGLVPLIFVSVGTGLLAGLAPVPGGIGVAEATMSALLTAVGVDPALSVSIAIIHRVVTSYLPPVIGYFSLDWLMKERYL